MSDRQERIEALRTDLTEKHEELQHRIEEITDDLRQKEPRSEDWEDRAQESENDEVLEALDDQGRQELQQIEIALERLKQGNFGECVDCGTEIKIERLEALPWAKYCIDCARQHERNR